MSYKEKNQKKILFFFFFKENHQIIVTNKQEAHCLGCVFEILARFLVATDLLNAFTLQVALQHLLHQIHVGPFGAQEGGTGRLRTEHCK